MSQVLLVLLIWTRKFLDVLGMRPLVGPGLGLTPLIMSRASTILSTNRVDVELVGSRPE